MACLLPLLSSLERQEEGVLVGNKRGTLQIFKSRHGNHHQNEPLLIDNKAAAFLEKDQTNGETFRRPSPVFCLDATPDGALVFSGAGDRYVSVWEKEKDNGDCWNCIETLGPHTGWVRSILYNSATDRLHSIGCNCIETWCRRCQDDSGQWQHWKKSTIESSPEEGATLSSDLLCLCPLLLGDDSVYFVAGGVDGRLHVWDSHSMGKPLFSAPAAHDGRVNAMEFSKKSNLLVTAGNDGKVKCWKCHIADHRIDLVGEFVVVGDEQEESSRVTCLWTQDFGGVHDYIFCGTNVGEVLLLKLPNGSPPLKLTTTFQLAQRPIVHCLCMYKEKNQEEPDLWVGHSNGLSVFSLKSFASLKSLSS